MGLQFTHQKYIVALKGIYRRAKHPFGRPIRIVHQVKTVMKFFDVPMMTNYYMRKNRLDAIFY